MQSTRTDNTCTNKQDKRMDGWIDTRVGGWMCEWKNRCADGRMDA